MQRNLHPIVNTGLQHLTASPNGIKALMLMVSAHDFVQDTRFTDRGVTKVTFRFKGSRKYNICKLMYDAGEDAYLLGLGQVRKRGFETVWKDVLTPGHAEDIKTFFEEMTGLFLTVPTIKGINA